MNVAEISRFYVELGLTGLSAIIIVWLFIITYRKFIKKEENTSDRNNKKADKMEDRFDEILTLLKKQNEEYQKQQQDIVKNIVNGVLFHVPSNEENNKLRSNISRNR